MVILLLINLNSCGCTIIGNNVNYTKFLFYRKFISYREASL